MKNRVYFQINDGGDGSAYVSFYKDEETLELAKKLTTLQNEQWGGFAEDCDGWIDLVIDEDGKPNFESSEFRTKEEVLKEIKEIEKDISIP